MRRLKFLLLGLLLNFTFAVADEFDSSNCEVRENFRYEMDGQLFLIPAHLEDIVSVRVAPENREHWAAAYCSNYPDKDRVEGDVILVSTVGDVNDVQKYTGISVPERTGILRLWVQETDNPDELIIDCNQGFACSLIGNFKGTNMRFYILTNAMHVREPEKYVGKEKEVASLNDYPKIVKSVEDTFRVFMAD